MQIVLEEDTDEAGDSEVEELGDCDPLIEEALDAYWHHVSGSYELTKAIAGAGASDETGFKIFCQLVPALEIVPLSKVRRRRAECESKEKWKFKRSSSLDIEDTTDMMEPLSMRYDVYLYNSDGTRDVIRDVADCEYMREKYSYTLENFDEDRHRVERNDRLLQSLCYKNEWLARRDSDTGELWQMVVCTRPVIVTPQQFSVQPLPTTAKKIIQLVDCPVCWLRMSLSSADVRDKKTQTYGLLVIKCGHFLCKPCYVQCLATRQRCPTCRGPLSTVYRIESFFEGALRDYPLATLAAFDEHSE